MEQTTPSSRPGRPAYEPTEKDRKYVRTMAGMGLTGEEIAAIMQISEPTLRKYYYLELQVGGVEANAAVAASLYRQATSKEKPNVTAAIFWLKCRAGWKEEDPAREPEMGKKAAAEATARVADKGTAWEGLLPQLGLPAPSRAQ